MEGNTVNLKTYQAYTMSEALTAVKHDLGADAVIINTRSFRRGGFLGIGRKTIIEVTATPNVALQARAAKAKGGDASQRERAGQASAKPQAAAANRAYAGGVGASGGVAVEVKPRTQVVVKGSAGATANATFDEKRERMQRMTIALAEKARRERQADPPIPLAKQSTIPVAASATVDRRFTPASMIGETAQTPAPIDFRGASVSPQPRAEKPVAIVGRLVGAEATLQRAAAAPTQPLNTPTSSAARRFILATPDKPETVAKAATTAVTIAPVVKVAAPTVDGPILPAPSAPATPSIRPSPAITTPATPNAIHRGPEAEVEIKMPLPPAAATFAAAVPMPDTRVMHEELAAIKTLVGQVLQKQNQAAQIASPTLPRKLFDVYLRLIAQEVSDELADQIVNSVREVLHGEQLENDKVIHAAMVRQIAAMIPVAADPLPVQSPDDRPLTLALVGPTGVGKTTTLAKLAASYKIRHEKNVGLITADTYRIAAVEQLRTYATIIDVPLEVAGTPAEMREAIKKLNACEVILIDTAGRSQNDRLRIDELRQFIEAAGPHEVHLVLSSTAGEKVLLREADAFGAVGVDKIALSKLDEAVGFGGLINVLRKFNKPLSFITTGQEVPDHLEVANAERLAEMVLGGKA